MDVDPMGVPTGMSTDSGGQPASAPGFNGNKTIGRLRTQGEPVHEPPAAESDKPQEKSGFQEFIDHEKHNVTEAAKHPWEAAKGAIKGTLNTVPALGDMVLKGGAYIYSTNAEQVAFALKNLGADGLSQSVGQSARSVSQAGQAVDLPKFQMSNAAQEGGDTIATVVTSVTGIAAVAKGGVKVFVKSAGKAENFAARSLPGNGAVVSAKRTSNFADREKLVRHFETHGAEFGSKNPDEYLQVGREIMGQGDKVEYVYKGEVRNGYVSFMGNTSRGDAKFGFVGTNPEGFITTIHTQSGNNFWKMLNGSPVVKNIAPVP